MRVVADLDVTDCRADLSRGLTTRQAPFREKSSAAAPPASGAEVWIPATPIASRIASSQRFLHAGRRSSPSRRRPVRPGDYALIVADLASGDLGPRWHSASAASSGVIGLTTYYPRQSISDPTPYDFTFEIRAGRMQRANYMMATISDVTAYIPGRMGVGTISDILTRAPRGRTGARSHHSTAGARHDPDRYFHSSSRLGSDNRRVGKTSSSTTVSGARQDRGSTRLRDRQWTR